MAPPDFFAFAFAQKTYLFALSYIVLKCIIQLYISFIHTQISDYIFFKNRIDT